MNNPVRNEYGESAPNWTTIPGGERWAGIEPLSARELIAGQQVNSEATHRVVMRNVAGLTSAHRIKHNGRQLEIEGITNKDDRNVELQLLCKEAV